MNRIVNIISIISLILTLGFGSALAQTRGPKIKGNVYGGGENAKVMGQNLNEGEPSTSVTINNGNVKGDVFGAGKGVTKSVAGTYEIDKKDADGNVMTDGEGNPVKETLTYDKVAVVYGNTEVKITAKSSEKQGKVWGNIYGGAALAIVDGETHVKIEGIEITGPDDKKTFVGGMFAKDVFGGGKGNVDASSNITSANVLKNTNVRVTGGEIIWNKKLDSNWETVDAASAEYFDREDNKFLTDHNIYAGGDIACIVGTWSDENTLDTTTPEPTGTAHLTMTRGLLNKDLLTSEEWKQAFAEHENPHFYAFGGGYGIYTKAHKSDVKILLPMFSEEGTGGGDQQLARPHRAPGGDQSLPMPIITDAYGVAWTTVLGILGGGYNGHVEQTNVLVGDATYAHRVYGGGLGSYEGWVEAGKPADAAAAASAAGKLGTVGPLTGEPSATEPVAHVTIAGGHIFGDVFGGGAGVASGKKGVDANSKPILDRTAANTEFTDFTEIARVKGNTKVETTSYETYLTSKGTKETVLASHPNKNANTDPDEKKQQAYPLYQRAQIFGNVYGGGDVANVSGNTNVSLFGGDVFGYTFGAGLGRLTTEAKDYTTIGNVSGNSTLTIADLVDWKGTSLPDDYEEPYKPTAWDDIYGGGRNGVTNGNAEVNINGGKLGNNIFGGGLGNVDGENITSADVKGNTTVTVTGGEYQWRQIADIDGNIKTFPKTIPTGYTGSLDGYDKPFDRSDIDNKSMHDQLFEPVKEFFDYRTASYTRDHSIYGGGNIACKVGTYVNDDDDDDVDLLDAPTSGGKATVDMQHGLFADDDIRFTDEDQWNLATLCRWLACENRSNYQFGVFGGGYGANTKVGSTQVDLHMGASDANKAKWNTYMTAINNEYLALDKQTQDDYYGGGVGENAKNRYLTARMARSINVPSHTVLTTAGGGLAGYVAGNTYVHQYERSGSLRVFGGGIGLRPSDNELKTLDADGAAAMTYGQVGGNTTVDVEYGVVIKDVYGGGAGVESLQNNSGNYVDFTNMARVKGRTDVRVHTKEVNNPSQTLIYGMVFGGGDVANVGDPATKVTTDMQATHIIDDENEDKLCTKVTVQAGCVFKEVFAGGSGRTANYCADYENLGAVYGNTQLVINQNGENSTWLWNDVYGGGRNGIVYGNTLVDIEGGWLGNNVFGGGLGNLDTKTDPVSGLEEEVITKANVTRNTNILVRGGQYCLSQSWDEVTRNWNPLKKDASDNPYSPQYDPATNKFLLSHNIYGGGNVACDVGNDTWVDMTKGLLPAENRLGRDNTSNLFTEPEWENIHNKHASAYFSVFGGGYGENTVVENNSNITIDMQGDIEPNHNTDPKNLSSIFYDRQSVLDVIGGGYEGAVTNTCNIDIKGNSFMRNVFGGAYYATVGNTVVNATRGNIENIYGGGMMGNVHNDVAINFGQAHDNENDSDAEKTNKTTDNHQLFIMQDIYGGNDVSGYVGAQEEIDGAVTPTEGSTGVTMALNGGTVFGNVYGGGNGNYLYMIDQNATKVTAEEAHRIDGETSTLVYHVPLREAYFPSLGAMTDQQKMVNLSSYRPGTMKVNINFKGNSTTDRLVINGNLFGGGNSATISNYADEDIASVNIDAGSHARLGGLFLGSDGDALFDTESKFIEYYPSINNMRLYRTIDWDTPENREIPTILLPAPQDERPNIYKTNVDLYFLPVEMPVMPELTWNGRNSSTSDATSSGAMHSGFTYSDPEIEDLEIGTFCCGGNRGNMDTATKFHIYFPEGLTITENIIGGCNNANYTRTLSEVDAEGNPIELQHTGGFLLGTHNVGTTHSPQINLTLHNKFKIAIAKEKDAEGNEVQIYPELCNVFGGCYESGTVRGDIRLEVFSNMLKSARDGVNELEIGLDSAALRRATDAGRSVCGIYGGGKGEKTWVYGDTEVRLGNENQECSLVYGDDGRYHTVGASCNYLFGGGRSGNVVGNSTVRLLNGRVGGCVVGASYSGYLFGNSQVIVGYPEEYYECLQSGEYKLDRVDNDPQHKYYVDAHDKPVIKQSIWHTKGDLVSRASYEEIRWAPGTTDAQKAAMFRKHEFSYTTDEWNKINIQIDKAVYGGGYATTGGGGVGSGSYTVRKYTKDYNLNEYAQDIYGLPDGITLHDDNGAATGGNAFGGNTFVMIADRTDEDNTVNKDGTIGRDHITVSSSQLRPITPSVGQNMFGKYHEVTSNNGTPDNPDDDFTTIEYIRTDILWDQSRTEKYYEYVGEGGIYGDGHLSVSEGFRLTDISGYGYNGSAPVNAKLMNCLHRFDIVRLTDCCFSLLGDRDWTTEQGAALDATPYSIASVGELKMFSSLEKNETLMDPLKSKRSRNYMGLSNRVSNIGAVYSNVSFDERFHHGNEGKYNNNGVAVEHEPYGTVSLEDGMTYREFKKKMIETNYDCASGKVKENSDAAISFQLRNDGTAKNLIGIGSGYALLVEYGFDRLKSQNILEEVTKTDASIKPIPDNQGIDGTYYGPVYGVFEVNLVSVREGEAGGYVYAQNMHEDTTYGSAYGNADHDNHFLEASGNFVFPVTSQRKVIDDCFPVKYTGLNKHTAADGHYWYVSGLKYFYNATITGYTFNDTEMKFDMPNANLITLAGAKAGQKVTLEDFHIVNRHVSKEYQCDFEREIDGNPYGMLDQTSIDDKAGKYMFSISTSKQTTYTESYEVTNDGVTSTVNVPYLQTMRLNNLGEKQENKLSDNVLDQNDAPISIRLTDNVNNNNKLAGGKSYYETYLSDPCQAVILLTVPAQDDNGFDVYNNDMFLQLDETGAKEPEAGTQYYILNFDGTYLGVKPEDLSTYNTADKRKLLYTLLDYRKLTANEMSATSPDASATYYISNDGGNTFTKVTTMTDAYWAANKNNLYLKPSPVKYEYTIDLTIRYIKGPSHSGHINIKNCALPGEMIRLSHENVIIESDEDNLPHNGNFWIVGPGKKVLDDPEHPENGWHWEFVDDAEGTLSRIGVDMYGNDNTLLKYNNPESRNLYYPYNPHVTDPRDNYRVSAFNSIAKSGIYHANSAENKEYYLPAYYYMNGYVAQYCYTVQGIPTVFHTDILPVDTICVHNYHRMVNVNDMPSNTGEKNIPHDLYVPMAAHHAATAPVIDAEHQDVQGAFAEKWLATHHRPRVYIQDVADLKAFAEYLQRTTETRKSAVTILPAEHNDGTAITYAEIEKHATDFGANTDFFLMASITVPDDWTPISNFKGALHGNGHVISGLGEKALFASLDNDAHIYNLGLPSGNIATTKNNATYSCCYTYSNKTVYRKDGTADTHYTDDDWRYGRVAYDLNEYYLAERHDRGNNSGADTHDHSGYVESLYADGDYRYARYNVSPATSEYLRNNQTPLYGWGYDQSIMEKVMADDDAHISMHDYVYDKDNNVLSHSVDEARALFNDDAVNEYRPLIDEAKLNSTVELTAKKNDYIFFGQTLNVSSVTSVVGTVGSSLPTVVSASANASQPGNSQGASHYVYPTGVTGDVNQTNRVWRTYGFYKSKKDDAFHFNRDAWALHKDLTAIDFTGAHDDNHLWQTGIVAGGDNSEQFFYPMPMDVPKTDLGALYLTSFNVMSNRNYKADGTATAYDNVNYGAVTQNLLVYNKDEKKADGTDVFAYKDANNSAESAVQYHNIVFSGSPVEHYSTDYFHLVDKQDFNAPIAFDVNTRAWYERTPSVFRNVSGTGESYATPSAWEGIILPFTANRVTASENQEISHFYGEIPDEGENVQTLHHEYWLTGMVDAEGDKATFARPSTEGTGLFTDARQDNDTYTYPANTYFTDLTNYTDYHDAVDMPNNDLWARTDAEWYLDNHEFADYVYLSKTVPYLISFPGNDFYEFSLEGTNYSTSTHTKSGDHQVVTFENNAPINAPITIAVSDDETGGHATTLGSHSHVGTYLHETNKLGVNGAGSAFTTQAGSVLPFRTYMTAPVTSANQHRVIRIADAGTSLIGEPESPKEELKTNYVKVWVEGHDIVVETSQQTALKLYTVSGMVLGDLNCKPGINRFPQAGSGIYIVGRKKLVIKR